MKYLEYKGFTLIELAMVVFIIGLLLSGLLIPISTQIEQQQRNKAEQDMEIIKEALVAFAVINGRLPCPASDLTSGQEDCTTMQGAQGFVPWTTLSINITGEDPKGNPYLYRADRNYTTSFSLTTTNNDRLMIVDHGSNLLTPKYSVSTTSLWPVAIIYSVGINGTSDGQNSTNEINACGNATGYNHPTYGTTCPNGGPPLYQSDSYYQDFDDVMVWLSPYTLYSKMMWAQKLP